VSFREGMGSREWSQGEEEACTESFVDIEEVEVGDGMAGNSNAEGGDASAHLKLLMCMRTVRLPNRGRTCGSHPVQLPLDVLEVFEVEDVRAA